MKEIPTAEEFYESIVGESRIGYTEEVMIKFAKLHVEAALKEVTEKLYFRDSDGHVIRSEESSKLVLKVYPLTNIK
jgi:hypothetical protein